MLNPMEIDGQRTPSPPAWLLTLSRQVRLGEVKNQNDHCLKN
jgi:hypothetical protein